MTINHLNKHCDQRELGAVMSCCTLNDMFDLANRNSKTNPTRSSRSVKLSEMIFQCATDISEPLNESVSSTTERPTTAMLAQLRWVNPNQSPQVSPALY